MVLQIMAEVYDEQILQLQTQIQEAGRASIGFQIHKHDAGSLSVASMACHISMSQLYATDWESHVSQALQAG